FFRVRLGGVLSSAYKLDDNNKLLFRALIDRNSLDRTHFANGITVQGLNLQSTVRRYTEDELDFGQLGGEHAWSNLRLDLRTAFSRTFQNQPDTRFTSYQSLPGAAPQFTTDALGGDRVFSYLVEYLTDSAVDFTVPFLTRLPFTNVWEGLGAKFK